MTFVMAYCVLLSAAVAAIAAIGDHVLRARRIASRGLWLIAMVLVVPVTGFVMLVPRPVESTTVVQVGIPSIEMGKIAAGPVAAPSVSWLAISDTALTVGWILASILLVSAIVFGRWRVSREKRRARAGKVQGHDVLLTEDLGPAVAGVRQPVVFVPGWVVALDDTSQRLLLAHEVEHVRRRDTGMLMAGAALTALVPWNPVAWWLARRLRIAVELDCDARVLAAHPDVRRYADLLLVAAGKPKFTSRFLAAHFGEHMSDLERRIEAMTNTRWQLRSVLLAAIAAVGLTMASCEAPRPEPVAPLPPREKELPAVAEGARSGSTELAGIVRRCSPNGGSGCQMSVIVRTSEGKQLARYSDEIPVTHLSEGSIQSIEVEKAACGSASCSLIWITLKPGELLQKAKAPERRVGAVEWVEPKRGDWVALKLDSSNDSIATKIAERRAYELEHVKAWPRDTELVARDTVFTAVGRFREVPVSEWRRPSQLDTVVLRNRLAPMLEQARILLRDTTQARIVLRADSSRRVMPNVVLLSSTGAVLREIAGDVMRITTSSSVSDIKPEDIASIEVYKGNSCPSTATLGCPLVRITLKPGREGAYRKR